MTIKYEPDRYEHRGFKPPSSYKKIQTINVGELENLILKEYEEMVLTYFQ